MVIRIGHRGARGHEPENTLLSFRNALDSNVDMIELDVHVCRTGELVVIHDKKVDRTTDGRGHVAEKTIGELRCLDAGKGERIPTIDESLDLIAKKAAVNIELKSEGAAGPVHELIERYVKEKGWSYEDFLISSSSYHELIELSRLNPNIITGAVIEGIPMLYALLAGKTDARSVHMSIKLANKMVINYAHRRGMKVFVWSVNNKEDARRMESLGVDGIFTDFPGKV